MRVTQEIDAAGKPVRTPHTGKTRTHFILEQEDVDAGFILYKTGPLIDGVVVLPTGAVYDVSDAWIRVHDSHRKALHRAIHEEHQRRGHFLSIPVPEG